MKGVSLIVDCGGKFGEWSEQRRSLLQGVVGAHTAVLGGPL